MFGGLGSWFEGLGSGLASGFSSIVDGLGGLGSSIIGGIGDLFGGLFSFLQPLIDFISWIMEFLGGLISGIGDFIWSLFESAINGLLNGVKTIVGWVGSFFEFLGNLLKDLFVPAENFFDDEVGKLNDNLNSKIDVSEFESSFNSLKNVKARSIPVPRSSNVMGVNIQFDWISGINEHIGTIHMFIRAFVYLILLRFNVNNVYKLIRGSNLYGGGDD